MIRRIFTGSLGALLGVLIAYGLEKLAPSTSFYGIRRTVFFVVACGAGLVLLGEKLRVVPTIEKLNEDARPPRILKRDEDSR